VRLQRWATGLRIYGEIRRILWAVGLLLLYLSALCFAAYPITIALLAGVACLAGGVLDAVYEVGFITRLESRAVACILEAEALEREHRTRYGTELPGRAREMEVDTKGDSGAHGN
jgi:hypothetical protein